MVPAIRSICSEYLNDEPLDRCIAVILREQCRLYEIIYDAGMFLSSAELADLQECVFTLGEHLQLARRLSGVSGKLAWQIKPTIHLSQHVLSQAYLINPRFVQCYLGESTLGVVTRMWRASASGPYMGRVQGRC